MRKGPVCTVNPGPWERDRSMVDSDMLSLRGWLDTMEEE